MYQIIKVIVRRNSGDIVAETGKPSFGFFVDNITVERLEDRCYAVAEDSEHGMKWYIPLNDNVELLYQKINAKDKSNNTKQKRV